MSETTESDCLPNLLKLIAEILGSKTLLALVQIYFFPSKASAWVAEFHNFYEGLLIPFCKFAWGLPDRVQKWFNPEAETLSDEESRMYTNGLNQNSRIKYEPNPLYGFKKKNFYSLAQIELDAHGRFVQGSRRFECLICKGDRTFDWAGYVSHTKARHPQKMPSEKEFHELEMAILKLHSSI